MDSNLGNNTWDGPLTSMNMQTHAPSYTCMHTHPHTCVPTPTHTLRWADNSRVNSCVYELYQSDCGLRLIMEKSNRGRFTYPKWWWHFGLPENSGYGWQRDSINPQGWEGDANLPNSVEVCVCMSVVCVCVLCLWLGGIVCLKDTVGFMLTPAWDCLLPAWFL